jgi:hypothetical protein
VTNAKKWIPLAASAGAVVSLLIGGVSYLAKDAAAQAVSTVKTDVAVIQAQQRAAQEELGRRFQEIKDELEDHGAKLDQIIGFHATERRRDHAR